MKKFVIGVLVGAMLFGGGAAYAASGVLAERSAQAVYVDGRRVELEAYNIDGSNYVKLRDAGQAVGFNVYWDGSAVQVESAAPYTGEAPTVTAAQQSAADHSAAANPDVFTELYTREAYNAAYEVLAGLKSGDDTRREVMHIDSQGDRWIMEGILGDLANGYTLSLNAKGQNAYEVFAQKVDTSGADPATDKLIDTVKLLSNDSDKVKMLNDYLCEKLSYDATKTLDLNEMLASPETVKAKCTSFAYAMNYLCGRVGIPCISVHGEHHYWNLIYCDGEWSYTDVSLNAQVSDHAYMLFSKTTRKQIGDLEGTRFLQELLVPGSTK